MAAPENALDDVAPGATLRPGDAAARALFDALRGRPAEDLVFVVRALDQRLGDRPLPEARATGLYALRLAAERLGTTAISKSAYKAFRSGEASPTQWPRARSITSAFGSWERASACLRGEPEPVLQAAQLRRRQFGLLTREAVLDALRAYALSQVEALTLKGFIAWCKEQAADERGCDPLPLSDGAVYRHFGGWGDLLIEAGLGDRRLLRARF